MRPDDNDFKPEQTTRVSYLLPASVVTFLVLLSLKVTETVTWGWAVVTMPLWGTMVAYVVLMIVAALVMLTMAQLAWQNKVGE